MKANWQNILKNSVEENLAVTGRLIQHLEKDIHQAVQQLVTTIRQGGKILLCGNGGSAADAQHIAAELVIRLKSSSNRPAIAALALTVDTSILTAGANDFGFDFIFSRQIEALGVRGDTLIVLSTSGNSGNVIEAANMAHEKGLYVIGFLGGDGGKLKKLVDLPIIIPTKTTARVQECHILIGHILCEILETELFSRI